MIFTIIFILIVLVNTLFSNNTILLEKCKYYRRHFISSLLLLECSYHVRFKWVSTNIKMIYGKSLGKNN